MRLPKKIMPAVEEIRRSVPKPQGEPFAWGGKVLSDWETHRFARIPCPEWDNGACPLGLHPKAITPTPYHAADFEEGAGLTTAEVKAFADYWDSLSLDKAEKVIKEIWK